MLRQRVEADRAVPSQYEQFVADPLSSWIEHRLGLTVEAGTGRLIRAVQRSLTGVNGAAEKLADETGLSPERCAEVLEKQLLGSYSTGKNPENGFPPFAFRLHQFISKGDTVYATLENEEERFVTVNGQQYVPGDRDRVLLPLVFCRECGQEYYCVKATSAGSTGNRAFEPREAQDQEGTDDVVPGYLYLSTTNPWPTTPDEFMDRLPEDWVEEHRGQRRIKKSQRANAPELIRVAADGTESTGGIEVSFIGAPFRFCLCCGVAYGARQKPTGIATSS